MDLRQLEVFVLVAQQGSFKRVAEQRYITQRAISKQIKRLEDELGVQLFDRKSNRILLTKTGQYFFEKVQNYLVEMHTTINNLHVIQNTHIPSLNLGYYSMFDGIFMREQLLHFQKENKEAISLLPKQESVEKILSDLTTNKIDAGYVNFYGEYQGIDMQSLRTIDLYCNKMVLGISRKNPLSKKKFVTEDELTNEVLLFYNRDYSNYFQTTFFSTINTDYKKYRIRQVKSAEEMIIDCSLNQGIMYVPDGLMEMFFKTDPNVVYRPLLSQKRDQNYKLKLVYRKRNNSKSLQSFISFIKHFHSK